MFKVRYLPRKPIFQSPGLRIRGIGIRETMPPCLIRRPDGTGDALFMLFHSPVRIGPPPQDQPHEAGTMICWAAGAPHHYGNPLLQWSHSWIHCDGPQVLAALRGARIGSAQPRHISNPPAVESGLFNLHEELHGSHAPDGVILRNLLENLLREMARGGRRRVRAVPGPLEQARQTLETRYQDPLDLAGLAAGAGLSIPHFCTSFRRHFGIPPISYLIRRRMKTAALLARGTTLDIGKIGERVGYDDPYHFSKLFKRCLGVSPSRFRELGIDSEGDAPTPPPPAQPMRVRSRVK